MYNRREDSVLRVAGQESIFRKNGHRPTVLEKIRTCGIGGPKGMEPETQERKLKAVMHADVKGYSRLMGDDDTATVRILTEYKGILQEKVKAHGGRVVDTAGDGFLVDFSSVNGALECAVLFQLAIAKRNQPLPESRRVEFRVGIHVGEVIEQGDKIFGDGVNIAARLEGLAEPGGICISGYAYEQVKKRSQVTFERLGKKVLKNIAEPVHVYRVILNPATWPQENKPSHNSNMRRLMPYLGFAVVILLVTGIGAWFLKFSNRTAATTAESRLMEKSSSNRVSTPSIAVLPFSNLSGDPEQDFFSDGITEEIITSLAKVPRLTVIASNSSFAFKGKGLTIPEVGRQLQVGYVLEGSVRRSGDRIRITAQLVDAKTGAHVWAERYDHHLQDIIKLQEEITANVVSAVQVKLTPGEKAWMSSEKTPSLNLKALEKFMQAVGCTGNQSQENNARARSLLEEAVALDPNFSRAYAALARTYLFDMAKGWEEVSVESLAKVEQYAQRAIALDDSSDFAHLIMSRVHLIKREYESAIREAQRAVSLNPNGADGYATLAHIQTFFGKPEEAQRLLDKAMRLNPVSPNWYYTTLGNALLVMKQYDEAIGIYKKALQTRTDPSSILIFLTATYHLAGLTAEAHQAAQELRKLRPDFSVEKATRRLPFKNPEDLNRIADALRAAGLN